MRSLFRLTLLFPLAVQLSAAELSDVQRIFAEHCLECHGPDKAKGGLRLTSRDAALKELKSGARAVVPGDLPESGLIARITTDDADEQMPPKDKKPLQSSEIEALKQWVKNGAEWPMHWAYLPIRSTEPPGIADCRLRIADWEKRDPTRGAELRRQREFIESWAKNPLDQFVLDGLLRAGIAPSPEADPYTLCRRVYLDLLGLLPTPDEADAFAAETIRNPQSAIRDLADRLLASPRFG